MDAMARRPEGFSALMERRAPGFRWCWVLILPVALAGAGLAIRPVAADPEPVLIVDPVADYLAMNVPDRKANAGQLLILNRRVRDVPRGRVAQGRRTPPARLRIAAMVRAAPDNRQKIQFRS